MEYLIDENRPIFVQIAERIENDIIAGELAEEAQVPSTNQFASFYQINPANGPGARESARMDFTHPDAADPAALNAILWRDRKGSLAMAR